jgi:hypothetical protein
VQHLNPDAHHQVGHVTYQRAPALFLLGATIALTRGTLRDFGPHLPLGMDQTRAS